MIIKFITTTTAYSLDFSQKAKFLQERTSRQITLFAADVARRQLTGLCLEAFDFNALALDKKELSLLDDSELECFNKRIIECFKRAIIIFCDSIKLAQFLGFHLNREVVIHLGPIKEDEFEGYIKEMEGQEPKVHSFVVLRGSE